MAMRIAERVVAITDKLQIPYVFKGSYRKANRSRLDSFMGIGDEKALKILKKVHDTFGVPTVTDIHAAEEAAMAAEYVDILQIPAFLCRQTDLLVAAAKTGKTVNIKKGQFLSPLAMQFAADKVVEAGNPQVMLQSLYKYGKCCELMDEREDALRAYEKLLYLAGDLQRRGIAPDPVWTSRGAYQAVLLNLKDGTPASARRALEDIRLYEELKLTGAGEDFARIKQEIKQRYNLEEK